MRLPPQLIVVSLFCVSTVLLIQNSKIPLLVLHQRESHISKPAITPSRYHFLEGDIDSGRATVTVCCRKALRVPSVAERDPGQCLSSLFIWELIGVLAQRRPSRHYELPWWLCPAEKHVR